MAINTGNKKTKLYISNKEVSKVYLGSSKIYPSGNTVTYHIDTEIIYQEDVDEGCSCLSPASFTPSKPGWIFAGWRSDTAADGAVLNELSMGDAPLNLYAVFKRSLMVSYEGNGSTDGATAQQKSDIYYNNGNKANAAFRLRTNGFAKTGYKFAAWAQGSGTGAQYPEGELVTLSEDTVFYAVWALTAFTPPVASIKDYIDVQGENVGSSICENHEGAPEFSAGVWYVKEGEGNSDDRTFVITPKAPYSSLKATLHWQTAAYGGNEDDVVGAWINGSELSKPELPEYSEYISVEGSSITIRLFAQSDGFDGHWKTTSSICMHDVTLS